ncbi:MAG: hypothetical protein IJ157_02030 [Clostridia bacterium]|nr:hypothetical protein [Clostridia bacterium]
MEQTAVRAHSGWREDEIDRLWHEIQQANENGQPLRSVFEQMGQTLGRKPNSVRNYYYMQLRPRDGRAMRRAAPFETFTEEEVRGLVRGVLSARARGQSVRAAVMTMSGGDHARMLRYQNKYRSVLKKRPQLIREVLEELRQEGVECADPLKREPQREDLQESVRQKIEALGDSDVRQLLTGMNALLDRALDSDPQTGRDRMRVRLDMAQLRYDALCRASGDMLLLCKEYLGQEEDTRMAAMPAFLDALSQHVTSVENAMH